MRASQTPPKFSILRLTVTPKILITFYSSLAIVLFDREAAVRRQGRYRARMNPRTFIVAVTYAASFSFITPLEPACVLVYTPGRYRFMDFVKVGTILTVIVFIVSILLVPIFWPFRP